MTESWACTGCQTLNRGRAACLACSTASPTATPAELAETALADAGAARAAQREEAQHGNDDLAQHLGAVVDTHLDDALALHQLDEPDL